MIDGLEYSEGLHRACDEVTKVDAVNIIPARKADRSAELAAVANGNGRAPVVPLLSADAPKRGRDRLFVLDERHSGC